jgi:hypothetical protein
VRPRDILDELYRSKNSALATESAAKLQEMTAHEVRIDALRANIRYEAFIKALPDDSETLSTADLAELLPKVL